MSIDEMCDEEVEDIEEFEDLDLTDDDSNSLLSDNIRQLSSEKTSQIFNTALGLLADPNVPAIMLDRDLRILYVSEAIHSLFKNHRKIENKPFFNVFGNSLEKDQLEIFLRSLKDIKTGFSWSGVLVHRLRLESALYTKTSVFPLFHEKELGGYWMVFENVTDTQFIQYKNMVESLLSASKLKDNDTGVHNERLNYYAKALSIALFDKNIFPQIDTDFVDNISTLAAIHDIGKIGTPDHILQKKGPLTESEWMTMREHTINGTLIMSSYPIPMAKEITLSHHEKWDGSGYPYNLSGDMIPLSARIVAIGDVYDALRMRRSYKEPMSHEDSVSRIIESAGTHFDPNIIPVFEKTAHLFDEIWEENSDENAS